MSPAALSLLLACVAALALGTSTRPAAADLGKNGSRIETSDYTIDLYEGPILAGARVIGLGGAYAPIAEGIAGYAFNPVAAAQRVPWSTSWFDWELDAGVTLPASIVNTDFDNNGDDGFTNRAAIFLTSGLGLQFGDLGVGVTIDFNQYKVGSRDEESDALLNVNFTRGLLVVAYSFLDGELIGGLGVSVHGVDINQPIQEAGTVKEQKIAGIAGPAFHAGALWAPAWLPLRVGASVRYSPPTPDSAPELVEPDENGNYIVNGYYLPRTISLPAEIHAGVAFQLFRPMNLRWINPRDEDSAARRAKRDIDAARARREQEAERRRDAVEAEGKDDEARDEQLTRLEEQHDREEERAAVQAASTLASAKQADRIRRRVPYERMPREKLLVSAAVKVTTKTEDGVGLESFLTQRVERSGTTISYSPRIGVEGEIIPGYLVLRAGSYYEPTRFGVRSTFRIHGTGGLDIHIPIAWSVFGLLDKSSTFRVGGAVDGALRYFGWGVTAGLWH
jgi:hypothetical protein